MFQATIWVRRLALTVTVALGAGCGAPPVDEATNPVEQSQQGLVTGNWALNLWNGQEGGNPFKVPATCSGGSCMLAVCAVMEADGRWHAGKLWEGHCRFEYANGFRKHNNYAVLQHPTSGAYIMAINPGTPPDNAIITPTSSSGGIPVCLGFQGQTPVAPGKVWGGTCRYEYNNKIVVASGGDFDYVVRSPTRVP
jgi:hypothetical protein